MIITDKIDLNNKYDVIVYGATSAGITAAIAAKKEGASVLLISQSDHIGGVTTSGLGATDLPNHKVVGGLSYDFYHRVYNYYLDPKVWKTQKRNEYFKTISDRIFTGINRRRKMMWVFEPKVALKIYEDMLKDANVPVVYNQPIDLVNGIMINKNTKRIKQIRSVHGTSFSAKVFIDCTYEGDLMMLSGVTYRVGRESNNEYKESFNGMFPPGGANDSSNRTFFASPYIVPGDKESGLLPNIEDKSPGIKGQSDSRVQAYTYRMVLTTNKDNMIPISKPKNYNPAWYETRGREFLDNKVFKSELTIDKMPNHKTDINQADFVGMSHDYPDGDYTTREEIERKHRDYIEGLFYFYAYDERVPLNIREDMRRYGYPKDEFIGNDHFPVQIYIREGRRLVSYYVMKQTDVISNRGKTTAPFSIGQGFYWADSHRVLHYADEHLQEYYTEGGFWATRRDYPISYYSIVPRKEEVENLILPVTLSASHAAYGSIRMEPTYMILGESAGTAAAMIALDKTNPAVQDIDYSSLRKRLEANGQILGDVVIDESILEQPYTKQVLVEDVIDEKDEILFKDRNLRKIILRTLNIKRSIKKTDLLKLTNLDLDENDPSQQVSDLSGIEWAHNLEKLNLNYNKVSDLSLIAHLTNLKYLNISYNKINDLSPLSKLSNLNTLIAIQLEKVENFDVISNLVELRHLNLSINNISNIEFISNLNKLEKLYLSFNNITKIDSLKQLSHLKTLALNANKVDNLSSIIQLKALEYVNMSENCITNCEDLNVLNDSIVKIDLSGNPLDSVLVESLDNTKIIYKYGKNKKVFKR